MLQKVLSNKTSSFHILLILMCFISIRAFENHLFYDPLLNFYKQNFQNLRFPEINNFKLALHFTLRYVLNSILSVLLLWILFKDISLINFSIFLYLFLFIILLSSFFYVMRFYSNEGKMILFYIRRFIIQPIFIMLFIPAFWYQKKRNS